MIFKGRMPFTVAHSAAALPIKGLFPRWFSLTGLMAGAVAPDLIFFLEMTTIDRGISHSWTGLFLFCLPAGIVFAFAFHWLIKHQLIVNLPAPWDGRLSGLAVSSFRPTNVRQWAVLVVSVLIGTLTHFFWDSFTHSHGELAGMFPVLQHPVGIFGRRVLVARIIQLTSNVAAFSGLWWAFRSGKFVPSPVELPEKRTAREKWQFWAAASLVSTVFAAVVLWVYMTYFPYRLETRYVTFGLAGWAGFFWMVAGYGVATRLVLGKRVTQSESEPELESIERPR